MMKSRLKYANFVYTDSDILLNSYISDIIFYIVSNVILLIRLKKQARYMLGLPQITKASFCQRVVVLLRHGTACRLAHKSMYDDIAGMRIYIFMY